MVPSTLSLSVKGPCNYFAYMLAFPSNPSTSSSHHALVDSGASIHILTCHTFLSDAVVNHSAVASFAGSTSRATHKGTFAALVQCTNNRFHRLVQKNSALVVPDASRMLFSISQALAAGHHVHFGNSPGLLLKDTKAFIPFVRDTHGHVFITPSSPTLTSQWHIPSSSNARCSTGYFYTKSLTYSTCDTHHAIPTLGHYSPQHIGPYRAPP